MLHASLTPIICFQAVSERIRPSYNVPPSFVQGLTKPTKCPLRLSEVSHNWALSESLQGRKTPWTHCFWHNGLLTQCQPRHCLLINGDCQQIWATEVARLCIKIFGQQYWDKYWNIGQYWDKYWDCQQIWATEVARVCTSSIFQFLGRWLSFESRLSFETTWISFETLDHPLLQPLWSRVRW